MERRLATEILPREIWDLVYEFVSSRNTDWYNSEEITTNWIRCGRLVCKCFESILVSKISFKFYIENGTIVSNEGVFSMERLLRYEAVSIELTDDNLDSADVLMRYLERSRTKLVDLDLEDSSWQSRSLITNLLTPYTNLQHLKCRGFLPPIQLLPSSLWDLQAFSGAYSFQSASLDTQHSLTLPSLSFLLLRLEHTNVDPIPFLLTRVTYLALLRCSYQLNYDNQVQRVLDITATSTHLRSLHLDIRLHSPKLLRLSTALHMLSGKQTNRIPIAPGSQLRVWESSMATDCRLTPLQIINLRSDLSNAVHLHTINFHSFCKRRSYLVDGECRHRILRQVPTSVQRVMFCSSFQQQDVYTRINDSSITEWMMFSETTASYTLIDTKQRSKRKRK